MGVRMLAAMTPHFVFVLLLSAAGLALWIWGSSTTLLSINQNKRFPSLVDRIGRLRPPHRPDRPGPWQSVASLAVLLLIPAGMAAMLRQGGLEPFEAVVLALGVIGVIAWTIGLVVVSLTSPGAADDADEREGTQSPGP
jgi:hypothetical protein